MKKHLNTLYVTLGDSYRKKEGEAVAVKNGGETRLRVPIHNLDAIVCLGWDIGASPELMAACAKAGVTLSFHTPYGKFLADVVGFSPGNVLLRREQYRRSDDGAASTLIAPEIVAAKLANSRSVLLRAARQETTSPPDRDILASAANFLARSALAARTTTDLASLRGGEGDAAKSYFADFELLVAPPSRPDFPFPSRPKRPPLDNTNALLSFLYSILAHDLRSACESRSLDAAVGFLHRDRSGRPSLGLDLMWEFRSFLANRLALSLINRKQLDASNFERRESGAVSLKDDSRKKVLVAYQERKNDEITHPFLDEKTTVGLLPHLQARHLRGDLDAYPPFLWKG